MLDIMYEIPKDDNIGKVTITKEYVQGTGGPIIDIRSSMILDNSGVSYEKASGTDQEGGSQ